MVCVPEPPERGGDQSRGTFLKCLFFRESERGRRGGERFFPLYNSNSRIQLFSRSPSREQRRRYKRAAESQDSKTSGREPRQQKEQSNDNDNDNNKNAAASERGGLGGKGFSNFPPLSVKQRSGPKERERGNRGPLPPQESFWKRKRDSEESPVGRRDQGPIPRERPRQGEGEGGGGKTKKTKQKRTEDEQARRCSCLPRSARAPPPASDDDGHREQVPVV